MYSDGVVFRFCVGCIFYYSPGGCECFCRSSSPSIPLRYVTHKEYSSDPFLAAAYDKLCDRYTNLECVLSDLRSRFDRGAK